MALFQGLAENMKVKIEIEIDTDEDRDEILDILEIINEVYHGNTRSSNCNSRSTDTARQNNKPLWACARVRQTG